MLSDHGFEKLNYDVQVNNFLAENGFLNFKTDRPMTFEDICPSTKAFALDPARIYINRRDKYQFGSVEAGQADAILEELEPLFLSLEIEGKKVVRKVFKGEDIYDGPYKSQAPDLVLLSDKGFNLKAKPADENLYEKAIFTGMHTWDTAFLVTSGSINPNIVAQNPKVSDIAGIITKTLSD